MKRFVQLLLCICVVPCLLRAEHTKIRPYTITENTVWQDTVTLLGDVKITDGILTIRPGTMVYFGSQGGNYSSNPVFDVWHVAILVTEQGAIQAVGTADSMITFTKGNPGGFGTIRFAALERDSLNILRYCNLIDGFRHVEFRNPQSNPGEPSRAVIDHCLFTRTIHKTRELMYVTGGANPVITNCVFQRSGAGIFFHGAGSDVIIRNTVFDSLSSAVYCGTMSPWDDDVKVTVDHCTFHNISGYEFASQPVGNGFGVITVNTPGTLNVHNSIFSHLQRSGIRDYNITDPKFDEFWTVFNDYNCFYMCDDGATMDVPVGAHSLDDVDPQMADPFNGDFAVWSGSPCWKAGNDGLNIGAMTDTSAAVSLYEPVADVAGSGLQVRNNPFRTRVFLLNIAESVTQVDVFDGMNNAVALLNVTNGVAAWDGRNAAGEMMPAGTYVYRAGDAMGTVVRLAR